MRGAHLRLAVVFGLLAAGAATGAGPDDLESVLSFERPPRNSLPGGWQGGPQGTGYLDDQVAHGGSASARLERTAGTPSAFSAINASIPIDFKGSTVELHGFLKTEEVTGRAGLWIREDSEGTAVSIDNMSAQPVAGTTGWTEYVVRLEIDPEADTLYFGALLVGEGKAWVDDLSLSVDGKPIAAVPKLARRTSALDNDHEFDDGSKVAISSLTPVQTANLALLGRVWGFLKYHHPKIVAGSVRWDYELFRVLPRVLAADGAKGRGVILDWVRSLGPVAPCQPCATLSGDLAIRPEVGWIHDTPALGKPLSELLENVYRNRSASASQAYVALAPGVGNPKFLHESAYPAPELPDAGRRILALYRWWNVVQYWSPYRDVIGADWDAVLPEFLPRLVAVKDAGAYRREMLAAIARLNDAHANLWQAIEARPPVGDCQVPVSLRFVEGKPVVTGYTEAEKGPATGLKRGDAIRTLDGTPVERLFEGWKPYYSASNDDGRMAAMMGELTQGECGPLQVGIERDGHTIDLTTERRPRSGLSLDAGTTHDLPGPAFRRLSPDVAYLKLSAVKGAEMSDYLKGVEGTKGWIVDIRNYPSEFMVFALGGHFVSKSTPFVRFTFGNPANPGAFAWGSPLELPPIAPYYPGTVAVLVDETSISQAEYTAMAFRSAPNAIVVGSRTVGADGNVSPVPLPGGLQSLISGIGVFYPDKKPTQRVGIVPDVEVRPTIAGIREGRDEVLEEAVRRILGPEVPEAKIREIAKP